VNTRPYPPLVNRYGSVGESGEWRVAIDAYYWDKMAEAYEIANNLSASNLQWYRMIEGEALTRERSVTKQVTPWLSIEHVPEEIDLDQAHVDAISEACSEVAGRLGWNFEMGVMVSILLEEVNAPWHGARAGYCMDKYPYDKICIPRAAAVSVERLAQIVRHEYTHVITLNVTRGRIPHWLDEGLAMLMEGESIPLGPNWLAPDPLNGAFEEDRRVTEGIVNSTHAYAQGAAIVRYLYSKGGEVKLAKLLRAFVNHGLWAEIKINLLGEPSVDEALHEVYGFGQRELFQMAKP